MAVLWISDIHKRPLRPRRHHHDDCKKQKRRQKASCATSAFHFRKLSNSTPKEKGDPARGIAFRC